MNVTNCRMCGRIFNVLSNERVCPACQRKLEDKFHEVKLYLEEHPNSSVEQTAIDNDVSTKQIRQWVKQERLILTTATVTGIVCEKCKNSMANELENAYAKPQPAVEEPKDDKDRMRYLRNE